MDLFIGYGFGDELTNIFVDELSRATSWPVTVSVQFSTYWDIFI